MSVAALAALAAMAVLAACKVEVEERNLLFPWSHRLPVFSDDIARRNLEVTASDGVALRGWLLDVPDERFTLVYFYGNGQSVIGTASELYSLADSLRADVMCLDYRGYGFSDGQPTLRQLGEDAVRVFDFAEWRAGGRPVVVMGYSLGSGAAVMVGARRKAAAVVLVAPPASPDAIVDDIEAQLPWYARIFFDLVPAPSLHRLTPVPETAIAEVTEPLLIIHGTADRVVPIAQGRRLFRRAASRTKRFCTVAGEGHAMSLFAVPRYRDCLRSFLSEASRPQR